MCLMFSCRRFVAVLHSFLNFRGRLSLESVDTLWENNFTTWREVASLKALPPVSCSGGGQWVNLHVFIRGCVLPLLAPDCNCLWKHLVRIQISWNQSLSQSFHGNCQVLTLVLNARMGTIFLYILYIYQTHLWL